MSASALSFLSLARIDWLHMVFHLTWSSASNSQLSAVRPVASMSLLQTSLKRSLGLPTGLNPSYSFPYKRSLGILPSSIRRTWPIHLSLRCLRRVYIVEIPALSSIVLLEILSVHEMDRMRRRHLMWKVCKRLLTFLLSSISGPGLTPVK